MPENYTLQPGVALTSAIKTEVKKIADAYHAATKKTITVTSGTRTAANQASAMYGKLVPIRENFYFTIRKMLCLK